MAEPGPSEPLKVVVDDREPRPARLSSKSLRAILASLLVGYGVPVLRTASTAETALWVDVIVAREERRLARNVEPTEPTDARVAMDVLGAIPGGADHRARRLLERFGSIRGVIAAGESDLADVPGVGPATASAIRDALDGAGRVSESAA